jgi:hypothetical protein
VRISKLTATALVALASIGLMQAQGKPATPTGLRLAGGGGSKPAIDPESIPPAPCGGSCNQHAYFNSLVTLPQRYRAYHLRAQSQLDVLTNAGVSNYFRYVYGADPHPMSQDAAKFYKPTDDQIGTESDSVPGNQQLRMPIGLSSGTLLITWDFFYGPEFRTNIGTILNYKTFQIRQGVDGRWWTHVNRWVRAESPAEVSRVVQAMTGGSENAPPGFTRTQPGLEPEGPGTAGYESYPIHHSKWTRYWVEIRLNQPDSQFLEWKALQSPGFNGNSVNLSGAYHMLSMWVADEHRGPTRLLYRVPWFMAASANSSIGSFDFEFNTSSVPGGQAGPLIGYGRNVVVLHNYPLPAVPESDGRIFVRPQ